MKMKMKMKSFFPIITRGGLLGGLLLLGACSDFLEKDVPNQIPEEQWWQSMSQLQTQLNNIYKVVPSGTLRYDTQDPSDGQGHGYGNNRVEMEALTDNGLGSANYVFYHSFDMGAVPTNDEKTVEHIWKAKWKAIRRCCRFLENYDRVTASPESNPWEGIQILDRYVAEARALRALFHLELMLFYGDIPIVDHTFDATEQFMVRQPREKVAEWIASEFELASQNLPKVVVGDAPEANRWIFTKGAAYAWNSYLYLNMGDWAKAKEWAQRVIDLDLYELYRSEANPTESYRYQFLLEANNVSKEAIFLKQLGMSQHARRLAPISAHAGQTGLSPSASLVDEYELADGRTLSELSSEERRQYELDPKHGPRDPRLTASIIFPRETFEGYTPDPWGTVDAIGLAGSTRTGYWIKKWGNKADWDRNATDGNPLHFQMMRYAVVLLNYVEAAVELNELDDPKIYEYLDDIRTRAGMPPVDRDKYNTQASLRELVRRERRVELAFEGHRLFDLRRWKRGDLMRGPVYGATNPNTGERLQALTRVFNERDYLFPIPASEMMTNPNMKQNPGY